MDNAIGKSTVYDYLPEGFTVVAAHTPALESALLAATMAGYSHISIDGTLIETDRCRTPGPTPGCGCVVVGQAHPSWREHPGPSPPRTVGRCGPLQVRPGREHDTTALREHPQILPALATWITENHPRAGDLGYDGESDTITVAFTKPQGGQLTDDQKTHNTAHNATPAIGEWRTQHDHLEQQTVTRKGSMCGCT